MVRPLPNGANWTDALLQRHRIGPGATIDVTPRYQQFQSAFPHHSEDMPISQAMTQHLLAGPIDWFAADAPLTHETVSKAFDGRTEHSRIWKNVRQGAYVPTGTQVRSLAAIRLQRTAIQFVEAFNKLKAILDDGDARYRLTVSSLALKNAWREGGVPAVQQALPTTRQFHVRLGLARAFNEQPDKCYLMVNGIHG